MLELSRKAAAVPPWLAALALLSATALGPVPAGAQSAAKDLDCKKCVDGSDIANKAVTKKQIDKNAIKENRLKDGAVGEAKLSTALQEHFAERESFFITLDGDGAEATIATHGPLTILVRCEANRQVGSGKVRDAIKIVATSSVDGWFVDDGNPNLPAGQEEIAVELLLEPPGDVVYNELEEVVAVAPDGSYLALEGDAGALGLNAFGHDCLAVGFIYRITGAP